MHGEYSMSTTLTNGLKLPDKGSVDWYADMQNNYNILDGTVGTVAEHTTALSGKAPLVHTHTKSDVTDLLNSNFIPSANDAYDLGSSSYQWNNLYAKNYYYNGVAWGLNKANVWSAWQTIERTNVESLLRLRRTDLNIGKAASNQNIGTLAFAGSDDLNFGLIGSRDFSNGDTQLILLARQKYDANNDRSTNGTQKETRVEIGINTPSNKYFRPNSNGDVNLGTSSNKWKSFNGLNPGALSLPDTSHTDIKEYITDRNYGANYYTAPGDGYVCVGSMASSLQISNDTLGFGTTGSTGQDGYASAYIPVRAGNTVRIQVNQTSTDYQYFSFYPCAGNV